MFLHLIYLVLVLFPALIAGYYLLKSPNVIELLLLNQARAPVLHQNGRSEIPIEINKDYPYQVSLGLDDRHNCGGVITSEYFIISARQCINGFDDGNITIGTYFLEEGGGSLHKNRHLHPQSKPYDCISILELEEPLFFFGQDVRPIIRLPELGASISDWGAMDEDDLTRSYEECKAIYDAIDFVISVTDRMTCGNIPDGGSCNTGGSVTHDGVVHEIVSWVKGCSQTDYPAAYTKAAHPNLRKFVRNMTGILLLLLLLL